MNQGNPFPCEDDYYCWTVIPEIRRDNTDVAIVIVTLGNVKYLEPVEDPLFAAHTVYNFTRGLYYVSDYHSGALGCSIQVSFLAHHKPASLSHHSV